MPPVLTPDINLASQILILVGHDPKAPPPLGGSAELFRHATRKQLLDCAQHLGLAGVSKLGKEDLADRVQSAFHGLRPAATPAATPKPAEINPSATSGGASPFPPKFDLGPDAEIEPMPDNIPWGYGNDRVTAMAVDPDRLYAYWEITEDAVTAARSGLGRAGAAAWLNVRVYDVSGRLFDGTNAHSYFDHRIERHDRQWFFAINKPTSSACLEVGLRSQEGYFVKIARSGRVDFARREPAPAAPLEWLSVRADGAAGTPTIAAGNGAAATSSSSPSTSSEGSLEIAPGAAYRGGAPGGDVAQAGWEDWTEVAGFPAAGGQRLVERRWNWLETGGTNWTGESTRTEWTGPVLRTEWEAGPFTYPIEVPSTVEVRDLGEMSIRAENGRVHIAYGPWQVVIRGLGARAERRVLGTWEYRRQVEIAGGMEKAQSPAGKLAPGSSDWLMAGSSERRWVGSSELFARGGSELWMLGASEARLRGASEALLAGASERRLRGASELSFAGASSRLLRGASERTFAGASERAFAGASERAFAGASERTFAGASERAFVGASERLGGGDNEQPDVPSPYPAPHRPGR